jgi:RNA polymerase sigma-70 factor (ECF subfamily)
VEAAIASCHCGAATFEQTDWPLIVSLYSKLVAVYDTPVVRLNRAVARGYSEGPAAALRELEALARDGALGRYYLLHASLGEFYMRAGDLAAAGRSFREALQLCRSPRERQFLEGRIARCDKAPGS